MSASKFFSFSVLIWFLFQPSPGSFSKDQQSGTTYIVFQHDYSKENKSLISRILEADPDNVVDSQNSNFNTLTVENLKTKESLTSSQKNPEVDSFGFSLNSLFW